MLDFDLDIDLDLDIDMDVELITTVDAIRNDITYGENKDKQATIYTTQDVQVARMFNPDIIERDYIVEYVIPEGLPVINIKLLSKFSRTIEQVDIKELPTDFNRELLKNHLVYVRSLR